MNKFLQFMGLSKNDLFTANQNRLAALAKALGHPARIAILQHLVQVQGCVCGDLVGVLPLSQATVSQHLKALKAVGIIQGEVDGRQVCYCIDPKGWAEIQALLGTFLIEVKKCC